MGPLTQMTPFGVYSLIYPTKNNKKKVLSKKNLAGKKTIDENYRHIVHDNFATANFCIEKDKCKAEIFDFVSSSLLLRNRLDKILNNDADNFIFMSEDAFVEGVLYDGVQLGNYTIHIKELAQEKSIISKILVANDKFLLEENTYSWLIESNGKEEKIIFYVNEKDNNRILLNNIAKAVNEQSKFTHAQVVDNDQEIRLFLSSNIKGEQSAFFVKDYKENLFDILFFNEKSLSKNAVIEINGEDFLLNENKLFLPDDFIEFKFISQGRTKCFVKLNHEYVKELFSSLVIVYNNFYNAIEKIENKTSLATELLQTLPDLLGTKHEKIVVLGINIDENKRLSFDEAIFEKNSTDNKLTDNYLDSKQIFWYLHNVINKVVERPASEYLNLLSLSSKKADEIYGFFLDINS